ncbi:hypothetical protein Tco_0308027 [Tanacetum coccineum]
MQSRGLMTLISSSVGIEMYTSVDDSSLVHHHWREKCVHPQYHICTFLEGEMFTSRDQQQVSLDRLYKILTGDSDKLRHDQKYKNMKLSQDMQLIQKLRNDQKRMKKVFEVMSGRNIVTNSRVTPSWREIVSLSFSEAGILHVNWTSFGHCTSILEWAVDKNGHSRIKGTSSSSENGIMLTLAPRCDHKHPESSYLVPLSNYHGRSFAVVLGMGLFYVMCPIRVELEVRISLIMFEFSSCLLADSVINLVSDSSRLSL